MMQPTLRVVRSNVLVVLFSSANMRGLSMSRPSLRASCLHPSQRKRCRTSRSGHGRREIKFRKPCRQSVSCAAASQLKALVFDCDGVIVESEGLHREAYNAAFAHFNACIPGKQGNIEWSEEFYDELQNKVGGGKAKMRWYFGENGWPTSTEFQVPPQSEDEQAALIDALQDWKSLKYQDIIGTDAEARPGVMRLMDEARDAGIKVAVCSAATKSSVVHVVKSLLGDERFEALDCFLAGDDVPEKKPDPSIYTLAAKRLSVQPAECLVVEDSAIGLQAAVDAGMRCVITYTNSSKTQGFEGAEMIVRDLNADPHCVRIKDLVQAQDFLDDREVATP
ncbi:hypothetical protein ABBQ38_006195 [Trebouxia sp. C0009 RCD-2024]